MGTIREPSIAPSFWLAWENPWTMAGSVTDSGMWFMHINYYFWNHLVDLRVTSLLSPTFTFLKRCITGSFAAQWNLGCEHSLKARRQLCKYKGILHLPSEQPVQDGLCQPRPRGRGYCFQRGGLTDMKALTKKNGNCGKQELTGMAHLPDAGQGSDCSVWINQLHPHPGLVTYVLMSLF